MVNSTTWLTTLTILNVIQIIYLKLTIILHVINHVSRIRESWMSIQHFWYIGYQIAGSTIYKSVNRICGTTLAGLLAFGVQWVASKAGKQLEPIIVGVLLFLLGIIFITNNNNNNTITIYIVHTVDLGNWSLIALFDLVFSFCSDILKIHPNHKGSFWLWCSDIYPNFQLGFNIWLSNWWIVWYGTTKDFYYYNWNFIVHNS